MFQIPIVDLRAQYHEIREDVRRVIDEVNDSQQFILGPQVKNFEDRMAAHLGCAFAVGVASGSDALLLALMALEIGPGDAVITTPFTFFSTVSSITRLGAKPLFVDIESENYLISVGALKDFLRSQTQKGSDGISIDSRTGLRVKALLPVHLFGQCCAMGDLTALAQDYHLCIVEDVAQACGARENVGDIAKFAGTIGDVGCFSFFPSKNLGGFGDGGMVTTNDPRLAEALGILRRHGESAKYFHDVTGLNSRLDSIQAAVLGVKLRHLESWCTARVARAATYHALFTSLGLVGKELRRIPQLIQNKSHVFNNYVIAAQRRNELKGFLGARGIQSEIYYPLPLHLQKCFASLGHRAGEFPNAERAAAEVLALPLYPELTRQQQECVVNTVAEFYRT